MKKMIFACLVLGLMAAAGTSYAADGMVFNRMQCENRINPQGIDAAQPRLSWNIASDARGLAQTAYQVLVASSPDLLTANKGDLWDSGKVQSGDAIQIAYAGNPIVAHQKCWWKVKIWDQNGAESAWSEPAYWTTGPMKSEDWAGAKWVGLDGGDDKDARDEDLLATEWIWYPEGTPNVSAPPESRYFRKVIDLPSNVSKASCLMSIDNEMTLYINGEKAATAAAARPVTELVFSERIRPGKNLFAIAAKNAGANPNPAGMLAVFKFETADGKTVIVKTDGTWKAANASQPDWEKPAFDDAKWVNAQVLGKNGIDPWKEVQIEKSRALPARMLRKEVDIQPQIRRATAYLSGLGSSELYVNGQKIGDDVLSPGLTEYNKRAFYVTHDVTDKMISGKNAIGVWLGNGRYYAPRTDSPTRTRTYGYPKMLLLLRVEMNDGSVVNVVSDETWKLTTDGPIRANNEYDGETYDARMEMAGWNAAGYDDSKWAAAQLVDKPGEAISAQMMEPIKVTATLHPIGMTNPKPGMYIFDMGQNMVGWCKLNVSGPAGAKVRMRFAETLRDDGMLYLDNIRGAKVTDEYIVKGAESEVYEPRFTYHGFRFVEMTGYPGEPNLETIAGCVVHDAVEPAGSFECSNKLVNQIAQNIRWGVRGNYRSISTDCPQRDERQGWLGDRSAECRGETYLFNISTLYAKWVGDMEDAQREDGSVSDVCPSYWPLYNDNVTWPSSFIIIPGMLYDQYGDKRVIERHYAGMKKWMEHMSGYLTKDDILPKDNYGDWCVPPEEQHLIHSQDPARKTPGEFLGTAYYYYDLALMAKYANLIGKPDDAKYFSDFAERIKKAFNAKFLNEKDAIYANGAQTTCVLPLAFGLAPDSVRDRLFKRLADKIMVDEKGHTGTGLIGGQFLMRCLSDNGRPDIAYTLASQSTYPSWGYMVNKGATTIWELWNGDTADPAMNSHNHVMLVGDLNIWLYEYLGGMRGTSPGLKTISLKPYPVDGVDFVKTSYRSAYGQIFSQWAKKDGALTWKVTVPGNTTAEICVPAKDAVQVKESGKPAAEAEGLKFVEMRDGYAVYAAGSGTYSFESAL